MLRARFAAAAVCLMLGSAAQAATSFDFTTLNGGSEGSLGTNTKTVNGVIADAFTYSGSTTTGSGAGTYSNSTLWLRNVPNDHGLGICSAGESCVTPGGGDLNELSSLVNLEVLRLTRPLQTQWTSLWLSSLDSNGSSSNVEDGTLYYSSSANPNLGTTSFLTFSFGNFGTLVEGDLFTLAGFNVAAVRQARYLFFKAGAPGVDVGNNNDYLVWKGTYEPGGPPNEIPEPGTYALMLAGLAMLGMITRRRTKA